MRVFGIWMSQLKVPRDLTKWYIGIVVVIHVSEHNGIFGFEPFFNLNSLKSCISTKNANHQGFYFNNIFFCSSAFESHIWCYLHKTTHAWQKKLIIKIYFFYFFHKEIKIIQIYLAHVFFGGGAFYHFSPLKLK